jgi:hypothetical protein
MHVTGPGVDGEERLVPGLHRVVDVRGMQDEGAGRLRLRLTGGGPGGGAGEDEIRLHGVVAMERVERVRGDEGDAEADFVAGDGRARADEFGLGDVVLEPGGIGARRVAVAPRQDRPDAAQRRKDVLDATFRGCECGFEVACDRMQRTGRRIQGDTAA